MESFEQLAAQYEPMIHKVMNLLHIYKNKDEFFQLGLIGLWEAVKSYNPEKGDFKNHAFTFIKGKFLDEMKKSNKHDKRYIHPKEGFWEVVEDFTEDHPFENMLILTYCVDLTPNQTKWVLYTCINCLTIAEIAQKENVSISAVKAWRKGAKEKLRKVQKEVVSKFFR